ncbi:MULTISPECIES: MarR family winged helix-turn-helix transcriptional regulator [Streptomycetaceae]|uniref:MarR family winged helix-turn-helix transcriptional regulator n=1 Tax=Streptomycetaceae TaxID=2062 RepID=UPI000CDCA835|nr:MarR family transcriptional regulator [Streptomyces sp. CB01881]AUY48028.1 MarR family transcriptional regulator [Streptomyces sp. CB01881]TYC76508.1 MarR family transcriptional regulator [Streptomyces sp. CB01881]
MADHVDRLVRQWGAERPDLDVSPMEVIGRLKRLTRLVEAELKRNFAAHDLDTPSFDVLATLKRSGPPYRLTPTGLMESAMVTSGAISQRLDRLEARGLVTRTPSGSDGRSRDVALTPEGHALVDRALPDHLTTERRILADLDPQQTEALIDALRTVLATLGEGDEAG